MFLKRDICCAVISLFLVNANYATTNETPLSLLTVDNVSNRCLRIVSLLAIKEALQHDVSLMHNRLLQKNPGEKQNQRDQIAKMQATIENALQLCIRLDFTVKEPKCEISHRAVADMYTEYVAQSFAREQLAVEGSDEHNHWKLMDRIATRAQARALKPYLTN